MRIGTAALRTGYRAVRSGLFRIDPEVIHERMIDVLGRMQKPARATVCDPVTIAGIDFPNRVGLAAGLDKDGIAALAWAHFGFGFAELGTVTALSQPGNPKPRIFRAPASKAIINRMGFNNAGAARLAERLRDAGVRRGNLAAGIPIGVSIGKTKRVDLADATSDYLTSLNHVAPYADYVAVNISSPNTPGLRSLQAAREVSNLLLPLTEAARGHDSLPLFVKLAPDLTADQLSETLAVIRDLPVSGIIATNTTLSREGLQPEDMWLASEAGGLSGHPLTYRALDFVERVVGQVELPVIGVGGIMTPRDAHRMFDAGARLLQLYTGFIYEGPALVRGIHDWSKR
ncbi:quinone-dependent dihydroorotate dehydrogenase [Tessaracoccus sp. OH4464_COT-324]|uniref:quinone-dependent dihydroorotate dehydrogenase n=1 Tax=Tessaracoccus sp. OH4464_COT-324 TaxID=2491059 RepID=UPI001F24AF62|nr:quinone-dependent dihydroorotate dehydrogenase [Tessaracoccus sp. OH4464_COT-324]